MEKISADIILEYMKGLVEKKLPISRETWIDVAFRLNLLRLDEAALFNKMYQEVAKRKVEMKNSQDKVNISAIELEIQATDEFRFMRDQADKLYSIDEFVRIAKKGADINL